ncbi:23S rRNA (guanosine(2251)-2'-O)-methyltransferase RlmB [Actinopolymorpha singaporensis]|uniref:23S rRNA (Guanosine2251-2'-O)-methyltransferase n=1 Tax=Actinopolymorpha singaporensis TaxID=117157 RepID=A0A1H1LQ50_9ACTN|nr:23S rRNA (guanosine(2251)-2'-O)-methyltransferase RlmB [Actinopolymorpha singaporensis]SDR76626.1 23S rRNA (guanosine2251-2'-O)-methyltransferase [Actinopolymorpha singaporensis]
MAGNSKRRGAIRQRSSGNPTAGSGGRVRRGLEGKGPTPRAEDRPYHKAHRRVQAQKRAAASADARRGGSGRAGAGGRAGDRPEWIVGRNPVVETLRSGVPVKTVQMAERIDRDDRVREILRLAAENGVPLLEVTRLELDRLTSGAVHQGVAVQVPPYEYADPDQLLQDAIDSGEPPLLVALDGVTDPRNLGAVVRSAAAFGAHGVVVPERRSAAMTAAAWKTSAGAAVRVPVARAVNLNRTLKAYQKAGLRIVGLAAEGEGDLAEVADLDGPVVLVAGSEGKGLSRLVRETADDLARIPMHSGTESLNAGVAAGIALYEVAQQRARSAAAE